MYCFSVSLLPVCVVQEKLIKAIKSIKHEVDACREADRETYAESVEVEVIHIFFRKHTLSMHSNSYILHCTKVRFENLLYRLMGHI